MNTGFTLPGRYYTDPEIFQRELERIFFSMWVYVGRVEEIPAAGRYVTREIGNESVLILNAGPGDLPPKGGSHEGRERREETIRAFANVCRHRGTRLCSDPQGELQRVIKCPYHGWSYDFAGRLVGATFMPEGFNKDDYPLHAVASDTWDGHVFININRGSAPDPGSVARGGPYAPLRSLAGAPCAPRFTEATSTETTSTQTLRDQLADLPEKFAPWRMQELRLAHRITYDLATNWKLIVLNYNECLHCPVIHPALNRLTHYLGADNEDPQPTYIGGTMGFKPGIETMSRDGRRRRSYLPGLGPREQQLVAYYVVYPNLLLSLHPDYMLTHAIWPIAPDRTRIVCEWHFHPEQMNTPGFDPTDVIEFWDMTNREDWAISERSYAGIRSRMYTPGPYSTREALLHAFDEWVRKRIDG